MNKKIVYTIIIAGIAALTCLLPAPVFGYDSKGKRDPFVPLVGLEKEGGKAKSKDVVAPGTVALIDIVSIEEVLLEGIAMGPSGKNIAILNGQIVKENDKFGILQVKKISKKTIELSINGQIHTLRLREEKGIEIGK